MGFREDLKLKKTTQNYNNKKLEETYRKELQRVSLSNKEIEEIKSRKHRHDGDER